MVILLTLLSASVGVDSYFQAAWIPSSYNSTSSEELCDQMMALQKTGIDRVYVDVWNQGTVYYKSPTMDAAGLLGSSFGGDRLQWASDCSTFTGDVFAWFEYGLIAAYGSINNEFAEYAQKNQWILGKDEQDFVWLNAANTDAVEFLTNLVIDVVRNYKAVRGVQLDDGFSQPMALLPDDADANVETMTSAAKQLSTAVRSAIDACLGVKPVLSLSPLPLGYALSSYSVDWKAWVSKDLAVGGRPLFDEVAVQLYTSSYDQFQAALQDTLNGLYGPGNVSETSELCTLAAGLRVVGSGDPTPWSELKLQLDLVRDSSTPHGPLCLCLWYSRGILETYPAEFSAYLGE